MKKMTDIMHLSLSAVLCMTLPNCKIQYEHKTLDKNTNKPHNILQRAVAVMSNKVKNTIRSGDLKSLKIDANSVIPDFY